MPSREFLIILKVICDNPNDDARAWPIEEMIVPPGTDHSRYVTVVKAVEIDRHGR